MAATKKRPLKRQPPPPDIMRKGGKHTDKTKIIPRKRKHKDEEGT